MYLLKRDAGVLQILKDGIVDFIFNPANYVIKYKSGYFHVLHHSDLFSSNMYDRSIFYFQRSDIDWENSNPPTLLINIPDNDVEAANEIATKFWRDDSGNDQLL
jgi:hypothetical protein